MDFGLGEGVEEVSGRGEGDIGENEERDEQDIRPAESREGGEEEAIGAVGVGHGTDEVCRTNADSETKSYGGEKPAVVK